MATSPVTGDRQLATQERAQAPIRWPHPDTSDITSILLWLVGVLVALGLPALIVPPGKATAPPGQVWGAFSLTVLGAAIMIGATMLHFRRARDASILVLGLVPGFSVIVGGIILAATKIYGV